MNTVIDIGTIRRRDVAIERAVTRLHAVEGLPERAGPHVRAYFKEECQTAHDVHARAAAIGALWRRSKVRVECLRPGPCPRCGVDCEGGTSHMCFILEELDPVGGVERTVEELERGEGKPGDFLEVENGRAVIVSKDGPSAYTMSVPVPPIAKLELVIEEIDP